MATDAMLDLLQRAWQMGYDKAINDGRSGQHNMVDASAQFRANYRAPDLEEIAALHAANPPADPRGRLMGFPMTVKRVVERNRLDTANYNLMDDLRRLAEDAVRLDREARQDEPSPALREDIVALRMAAVYPDGRPDRNGYAGGWNDALDEVLLRLAANPPQTREAEGAAPEPWVHLTDPDAGPCPKCGHSAGGITVGGKARAHTCCDHPDCRTPEAQRVGDVR